LKVRVNSPAITMNEANALTACQAAAPPGSVSPTTRPAVASTAVAIIEARRRSRITPTIAKDSRRRRIVAVQPRRGGSGDFHMVLSDS